MLANRLPEEDIMVQQIEDMCKEIDRVGKEESDKAHLEELLNELEILLQDFKVFRDKHGLR